MTSEDHCWTDYPVTFHHPWEDGIFLLYRGRKSGWLLQTGGSQQNKEQQRSQEEENLTYAKGTSIKKGQQTEYFLVVSGAI